MRLHSRTVLCGIKHTGYIQCSRKTATLFFVSNLC